MHDASSMIKGAKWTVGNIRQFPPSDKLIDIWEPMIVENGRWLTRTSEHVKKNDDISAFIQVNAVM